MILGSILFMICLLHLPIVEMACHNNCNRNGNCNQWSQCQCFEGWKGLDCSLRKCAVGPQIGDIPTSKDTAHAPSECSGRGVCDGNTGQCNCDPGYEGHNCGKSICPNNCHDVGDCISLRQAASFEDGIKFNHSTTYDRWDADIIFGCRCLPGYSGPDCSEKLCDTGPDPRSSTIKTQKVVLYCKCDGSCTAGNKFKLSVMGTIVQKWFNSTTQAVTLANSLASVSTIYGKRSGDSRLQVTATTSHNGGSADAFNTICVDSGEAETIITFRKQTDMQYVRFYRNLIAKPDVMYFINKQTLTCDCTSNCAGTFRLSYDGEMSPSFALSAKHSDVTDALNNMQTMKSSNAIVQRGSSGNDICTNAATNNHIITFNASASPLPLLVLHSAAVASISGSVSTSTSSVLSLSSTDGRGGVTKVCGGIGTCNYKDGSCECPRGWANGNTYGGCSQPDYSNNNWPGLGRCPGLLGTNIGDNDLEFKSNLNSDRVFISYNPHESLALTQNSYIVYLDWHWAGFPALNYDSAVVFANLSTNSSAGPLVVDDATNMLFAVDNKNGSAFITRASIKHIHNDTSLEPWVIVEYKITGVALDPHWNRRRLYFSISKEFGVNDGSIRYVSLDDDTPSIVTISSAIDPAGMAVHFIEEYLYFLDRKTESSQGIALKKWKLDGTENVQVFATYTNIDDVALSNQAAYSLTLRYSNNTAIFADLGTVPRRMYTVPLENIKFEIPGGNKTAQLYQYFEYFNVTLIVGTKENTLGTPTNPIQRYNEQNWTSIGQQVLDPDRDFLLYTDPDSGRVLYRRVGYNEIDPFAKGVAFYSRRFDPAQPKHPFVDTQAPSPVGLALDKGFGPMYTFGNYVDCYGKGRCTGLSGNFECECFPGYIGNCKLRSCPKGKAWFHEPLVPNIAHDVDVECSNAGSCNRESGQCECFSGFVGAACERTTCQGVGTECSGNGLCRSLKELASYAKDSYGEKGTFTYGNTPNDPDVWDADRIQGCVADEPGYIKTEFGIHYITPATDPALDKYECPTGMNRRRLDNIQAGATINVTLLQEVQEVNCTADGGTFTIKFRGYTTNDILYNADMATIETELELLHSIGDVTVVSSTPNDNTDDVACDANGNAFKVSFFTELQSVPAMVVDSASLTNTGGSPALVVTTLQHGDGYELECGGKGTCDYFTGKCECWNGWGSSNGYGQHGRRGDCAFPTPR